MISAFTYFRKELNGYLEYQNMENSSSGFCMENS